MFLHISLNHYQL